MSKIEDYTKGKWPKKLVINQKQTDIGFLDNMGLFEPIVTKELATEVCHRFNSYDALLEACEQVLSERPLPGFLTRKLQKAIAQAEP